ncbi:MAG: pilus assembly protein PilY, partial [Desulfurivibrionaceae bacterium]
MCNFRKALLATALLLCTPGNLFAANIYNAEPPFLPAPVSPNVLMVVDVSGSMSWSAYNPRTDRTGWCSTSTGCGWPFLGTEEGNWIPSKKYKQNSGVWEETADAALACPNRESSIDSTKTYTGACLNFLLMSRMDLLRWAMTGGRPNICTDGEYTSTDCDTSLQAAASATGFLTIHTANDDKVKVPVSRIQEAVIPGFSAATVKPRFGLLFYSDSIKSQKVYVGDYPEGNNADATLPYTYFTRYLNARSVSGGTGTAAGMWEAYDYFKQSNDHAFTNEFAMAGNSTKYRDPLYVCDYAKNNCGLVPCAKNFVILATDGQWNLSTS